MSSLNNRISKYYNQKEARDYEFRRKKQIWFLESSCFNTIKEKIYKKCNKKLDILDIPVGTGRWIYDLQNISNKYVGSDVSKNMLEQANLKLKNCSKTFRENSKLINCSIDELPNHLIDKFDLIIMTRFLPHFSIYEVKKIMEVLKKFLKGNLILSVRVTEKKKNIFLEILNLILKSPLGAIKRYIKAGRLSYTKLDKQYYILFKNLGYKIEKRNLVIKDKYSQYEYWELTYNV